MYIFFGEVAKISERGTSHHFPMEMIVMYDSPDILPYMGQVFIVPFCIFIPFVRMVMLHVAKFDKVAEFP
jgi:hypothetical protein